MLVSAPVQAHHAASSLGSVRLAQPATVGSTTLQPGTYEIRLTGEHVKPLAGQSEESGQYVEFVMNGTVAAKAAAEVIGSSTGAVGTSGATSGATGGVASRARVEMLRGGEFLRISMNKGGERFLIHLGVAN
jgi:hypothetical protein